MSRVEWKGKKVIGEVRQKMFSGMKTACLLVERDAKIGCPVDTGRLRGSLTNEIESKAKDIVGRVGSKVKYAPYVELGTSKMPAQPYLRPALHKNESRIKKLLGAK